MALPAILGGRPAVTAGHDEANRWPRLDERDERAVLRVLRDGNLSTHPVIRELEADYAALAEVPHALAHANGTAALHAAFFALELRPGDEVLVPSATFWASVLPIVWAGAIPVFCESEPERLGIDPADMARKITPRTRAVVVVHLWGLPARMSEIRALTERHALRIVEDASHAHGARWRGRPCGGLGDIGVFSLQGDKLAPAGEGGMLLCRDPGLYERAVLLGDVTRIIELDSPAKRFAGTSFGVKSRIAPVSAAVGRSQLARLSEHNAQRNANIVRLSTKIEALGIHTFLPPAHVERTYFEFIVRCEPERTRLPLPLLAAALHAEGCQVSAPRYPLVHQQPFFTEGHFARVARLPEGMTVPRYDPEDLPATRAGREVLMKLPAFPTASPELLDQYAEAFEKVLGHADAIESSETAAAYAADVAERMHAMPTSGVALRGV